MGVVRAFKDHRSLSRTLQDSEHIARKLGLIIMGVILFILMVRAGGLVPWRGGGGGGRGVGCVDGGCCHGGFVSVGAGVKWLG